MNQDEIAEKFKQEKVLRKKAEKRVQCLKKKINEGMKEFGETDNNDFNDMFNLIEEEKEEKLSEGMKIFYNVQEENLGKKSIKGYRWHPK